jgi:hypothetical protein
MEPIQPPIQWVTEAFFLRVKQPGNKADHSLSPSAEVKNAWSYTVTLLYVFIAWCLIKHRRCLHGVVLYLFLPLIHNEIKEQSRY